MNLHESLVVSRPVHTGQRIQWLARASTAIILVIWSSGVLIVVLLVM
jgi:hypothetical protein